MSWKALITDAGNELSAKTISGGNIKLTHAKAGSGTISEQDLHLQTELVNVKQTLSIESIKYSNAVNNIEILLDCRGLKEAYDLTQIGIYATDPDAGEILFAIAQTENPKHIPAENEVPFYSIDFNFAFALKNNQNMVATIDQSTFATKEQLSAVDARIDNIIVNAGSTEDNVELIDMRVDVDGKRHSTAGEALRSQLKQKANLTDISSPYQFKGACLSANLPGSGNKINDTYYVTDKKCKFTWNGAAWYQSSLNESDYEEELSSLTEDLGKISEIAVDKTENLLDISKEKINIRPQGYNAGQSLNDLKLKQEEGWITYNVVSASPGDSFYFLQGTTIIRAFLELYNSDGTFSRGVQIENKRPVILQYDEKYILISKNWKTDPLGLSPDGTEQFKSTTADLNIYEAFGYKEKDLTKNENLMRYFESLQEKKQSKSRDVIIDTDWAGDVDDAVAIKTALWAEEQGLFKIKAILINSMEGNHCQTLNAFLTGYSRGDIPIGINNNGDNYLGLADWKTPLLTSTSSITKNTECEDALRLYRKVLANSINKIDIISIGNFHNLSHLVDSEADYISDKTGLELVEDKVNIVYCMGGRYPSGSEYNFNRGGVAKTIETTKNFLSKWNTDVIFVGAEVADTIIVGSKLDNIDPKRKELLTQVLYAYNGNKPNIGRPAYDPCTVYLAAIGDAEKCGYDVVRGTVTIDDSGNNSFITSNTGKHYYVVKKKDDSWYQSLIDSTLYSLQGYYY